MAFTNRIGNLLKNTIKSSPSIYQSIRCMSSSKLFIGGISYQTDDQSLRDAFSGYGEVVEARVILDRESGRSRGFGFVTFTSSEEASAAISGMDGKMFVNAFNPSTPIFASVKKYCAVGLVAAAPSPDILSSVLASYLRSLCNSDHVHGRSCPNRLIGQRA